MIPGVFASGAMGSGGVSSLTYHDATASLTTTDTTPHSIAMPATVNAGDLLLMLSAYRAGSIRTYTTPSGWSTLAGIAGTATTTSHGGAAFIKTADGSEGGTSISLSTNAGCNTATLVIRVSGWTAINGTAVQSGDSTTSDPPSHASGYSGNILWIAGFFGQNGTLPTVYPTGFTDNQNESLNPSGTRPCRIITATKFDTAATVNPSAYTVSALGYSRPFTLAIQP